MYQQQQESIKERMAEDREKIDNIKQWLRQMDAAAQKAKVEWPGEPETRVKQSVHRALTSKFNELLKDNIQV